MLGVMPEHLGKKLGNILVLNSLDYFEEKKYEEVHLVTVNYRLPVIKNYLHIGFKPVLTNRIKEKR
jgi:hypothetical protein